MDTTLDNVHLDNLFGMGDSAPQPQVAWGSASGNVHISRLTRDPAKVRHRV